MTRKRVLTYGSVLCIAIVYALLFHTKLGLSTQWWFVTRYELHQYSRFLVPWFRAKKEFKSTAAHALRQAAIDDLYQARQVITSAISDQPNAENYRVRGFIDEMWGANTNALHDYEEALRLRLDGDGNMDISIPGLSNSIRRVRLRLLAESYSK